MPGSRITPDQKQLFIKALQEGNPVSAASEFAGFSYITGRRLVQEFKQLPANPTQAPTQLLIPPHPLARHELTDVALDCLNDFGRYRARQFGRKSSPWQENAAHETVAKLNTPYKEYGVVNCPPGSGKSTLFTHDIPSWLTARSRSLRGFIGSSTQVIANSYTGRLRSTFERTIPIQAKSEELARGLALDATATLASDYGLFRPDQGAGIPWTRGQFTVVQFGETLSGEKEATWTAFGRDTGFLGWRVNFIVWDDLVTKARLKTMEMIEGDRSWWIDEAETRLEPGGLLLLQGQRLGAEDLYRYNLDQETGFDELDEHLFELGEEQLPKGKKYFHIKYKAHHEEVCIAKDHPETHLTRADPYNPEHPTPGACLLDPVRLPWRELTAIINRPLSNYRVVYQQEDVEPAEVLVPQAWIDGGVDYTGADVPGCYDDKRGVAVIPKDLTGIKLSIVTVDPSPTKFWSIQWWLYVEPPGADRLMGFRYLLDMFRAPMDAPDLLDWNVGLSAHTGLLVDWQHRAKQLGLPINYLIVEKNAAQRFLMQYEWFKRWCSLNSVTLKPHSTHVNKLDEEFGVKTIKNHYRFGRVRLPGTTEGRKMVEPLVTELTRYPDSTTDDCVMANWFMEYQLQFLVAQAKPILSIYNDIPSWAKKDVSYA